MLVIILLYGQGHINVYATFLIKNGFKTEWTSEQKSLKCAKIFEYEKENFLSIVSRRTSQFFLCLVIVKHIHIKIQLSLNIQPKKKSSPKT